MIKSSTRNRRLPPAFTCFYLRSGFSLPLISSAITCFTNFNPVPLSVKGVASAAIFVFFLGTLSACATLSFEDHISAPTSTTEQLQNQLSIASAALDAGQITASRQLYVSLKTRFPSSPEPLIGLGKVAFRTSDLTSAKQYFARASELATTRSAQKARAEFGLARVLLAEADPIRAQEAFQTAKGLLSLEYRSDIAPWIENGLAVAATDLGGYDRANGHFLEALSLSDQHPAIAANYVRMLHISGSTDDANQIYNGKSPTFWLEEDRSQLKLLLEENSHEDSAFSHWKPIADVAGPTTAEGHARMNGGLYTKVTRERVRG